MFKIPSILRAYRKDERGQIAIIFAGAIIPIGVLIGTSYDFGRAFNTREAMQQSIDAAVFAAGREFDKTASITKAEAAGRSHFEATLPHGIEATVDMFKADAQGNIEMRASADVDTTFLKMGGTETMHVSVDAKSLTEDDGGMDLELAIVFDVTGSMGENRGAKLKAAKDAAKDLINILMPDGGTGERNVRISIVPFSSMVNLGEYAPAAMGNPPSKYRTCKTENPPKENGSRSCKTWNSYVNGSPSSAQLSSGVLISYQIPKACTYERMDWTYSRTTGGSDDRAYGDAPPTGTASYFKYSNASSPTSTGCTPGHPIIPLTDLNGKDDLLAAVDAFTANGSTAGHIGTAWGWYTISPRWQDFWPAGSKPADPDPKLLKAVIIMTDGIYNTHYKSNGGSVSEFSSGTTNPNEGNGTSRNQAVRICDAMKAAPNNVEVFAVGVELPTDDEDGTVEESDYARATLTSCVSSPNHLFETHFYDVISAIAVNNGLRAAFQDIGNKIATATGTGNSRLRLTR